MHYSRSLKHRDDDDPTSMSNAVIYEKTFQYLLCQLFFSKLIKHSNDKGAKEFEFGGLDNQKWRRKGKDYKIIFIRDN